MSTIIEHAEADLRKAEEAATRALQERDLCRAVVQRLKSYATEESTASNDRNGHAKPLDGLTVAGAIEHVLRTAERPLLIDEIIDGLRSSGRATGGKDPKANIASVLSRSPRFSHRKGRGWSLTAGAPAAGA